MSDRMEQLLAGERQPRKKQEAKFAELMAQSPQLYRSSLEGPSLQGGE